MRSQRLFLTIAGAALALGAAGSCPDDQAREDIQAIKFYLGGTSNPNAYDPASPVQLGAWMDKVAKAVCNLEVHTAAPNPGSTPRLCPAGPGDQYSPPPPPPPR